MPPSNTTDELPPLTNQDVEVLYTIVTTAATLPGPSYRALFTAYDRVLADRGINANHDRIYFRFLLRMRAREGAGASTSMYARFEQLLAEMGIQIEVDDNGEGVEEVTRHFDDLELDGDGEDWARNEPQQLRPRPARRASFDDTMYENTAGLRGRDEDGDDESLRRLPSGIGSRPRRSSSQSSHPGYERLRRRSSQGARPAMHSGFPRGRMDSRNPAGNLEHGGRGRPRSVSSHGSIRITRTLSRDANRPEREPSFEDLDGFDSTRSRRSSIPGPGPEPAAHYVPPEMLYRPSPADMLADAETFLYARTISKARQVLRKWHDQALGQRQLHAQMEEAADAMNRRKLLDAALEMLNVTLKERQQQKETERFFQQLERRADKARDLFLLTKAFTHWANSAADEVERTSVARRHILRYKYFNAWHEITAVEELKVRRQQLGKFFNIWRRRNAEIQEDSDLALAFRSETIVQQAYQSCYWEFSERRAAKYHDTKLKRNALASLLNQLSQLREREARVEERREHELKRKSFRGFSGKMLLIQSNETIADDSHKRHLLRSGLENLRLQARLRPLERQTSQAMRNRLAKQALSKWRVRAQQSRRATEIDRERILRNAFTAWNDNLRCRALAARIDERVLVEALYKWSLASRAALLSRLHNARTKQNVLLAWAEQVRSKGDQLARREQIFAASQQRRLKSRAFACLKGALEKQKVLEGQALSIYEPRIVRRTWQALLAQHDQVQQLEQWGSDAQFYTLTKHALVKWRESTQLSQRRRKRDAYATIRRRTKLSLARNAFETWRNKAANVEMMERQAHEKREDAVLHAATQLMQHWHEETLAVLDMAQQAEELQRRKLLASAMGALRSQLRKRKQNAARAETLFEEHVLAEANGCLRKFRWRLFNIQRHEPTSRAFAERNFEKHVKSMLRHWADQAMQSRQARMVVSHGVKGANEEQGDMEQEEDFNTEGEPALEKERDETEHNATASRNEGWAPFNESALGLGNLGLDLSLFPGGRNGNNNINAQPAVPLSRASSPLRLDTEPDAEQEQEREREREQASLAPNPLFARTLNNAPLLNPAATATPQPAYLRTPSKRSTVRAMRLAALNLPLQQRLAQSVRLPVREREQQLGGAQLGQGSAATQGQEKEGEGERPTTATATVTAPSASTFVLPTATGSTTPAAAPPPPLPLPAMGTPAVTPFARKLERGYRTPAASSAISAMRLSKGSTHLLTKEDWEDLFRPQAKQSSAPALASRQEEEFEDGELEDGEIEEGEIEEGEEEWIDEEQPPAPQPQQQQGKEDQPRVLQTSRLIYSVYRITSSHLRRLRARFKGFEEARDKALAAGQALPPIPPWILMFREQEWLFNRQLPAKPKRNKREGIQRRKELEGTQRRKKLEERQLRDKEWEAELLELIREVLRGAPEEEPKEGPKEESGEQLEEHQPRKKKRKSSRESPPLHVLRRRKLYAEAEAAEADQPPPKRRRSRSSQNHKSTKSKREERRRQQQEQQEQQGALRVSLPSPPSSPEAVSIWLSPSPENSSIPCSSPSLP
ncbi:uncharacterized protein K452DRAFT_321350 [Aplosporella prunicola CBS 121167]|uniref:Sfi1 spindle body domain-containing protein n=1 Tax=Aplosporella prunicola CBS 121167 TaxID=1176127 RepID=A0A6A6B4S8_9PEZI|nr:uncharacterized protein K452DRAFT_321350 [Aplosporella prunicola CBS 121167]KAF2137967.1 hypothetical protein K452DRAFT_321350 [Aplosporella prunicola CBS 121167]